MATAAEVTKIAEGGPSPFTDYYRKVKRDGGTTTTLTGPQLAESCAGMWSDYQKQAIRLGEAPVIA